MVLNIRKVRAVFNISCASIGFILMLCIGVINAPQVRQQQLYDEVSRPQEKPKVFISQSPFFQREPNKRKWAARNKAHGRAV